MVEEVGLWQRKMEVDMVVEEYEMDLVIVMG